MASHNEKGHVAPHSDCLHLRNAVVPLRMPVVACNVDFSAMVSHNPKIHVAPQFDCPDLRNTVVPWMTSLASHDADVNTNCVT